MIRKIRLCCTLEEMAGVADCAVGLLRRLLKMLQASFWYRDNHE